MKIMPIETLAHDIAGGIAETFGMNAKQRQWMYGFIKAQMVNAPKRESIADKAKREGWAKTPHASAEEENYNQSKGDHS